MDKYKNLIRAIQNCVYFDVESLLIDGQLDPLQSYDGSTPFICCFQHYVTADSDDTNKETYKAMLENVFLPLIDRIYIRQSLAQRDDWMVVTEDGDIQVIPASKPKPDGFWVGAIGSHDHFLSDFHRDAVKELARNTEETGKQYRP